MAGAHRPQPWRALGEDLELPLALRNFGVDAFMIDAGVKAKIQVLIHDLRAMLPMYL
jgi:hypothetical protein